MMKPRLVELNWQFWLIARFSCRRDHWSRVLAVESGLRAIPWRFVIKRISETSRISAVALIAERFRLVRRRLTNRFHSLFTLGFAFGTFAAITCFTGDSTIRRYFSNLGRVGV